MTSEVVATRPCTWSSSRGLEWARHLGGSLPMRMTASWFRSSGIDRIQVCGAKFAPDGELPSDRFVIRFRLSARRRRLARDDRSAPACRPNQRGTLLKISLTENAPYKCNRVSATPLVGERLVAPSHHGIAETSVLCDVSEMAQLSHIPPRSGGWS